MDFKVASLCWSWDLMAKADAVKEAYINAFNWMSAELRKYSESYEAERNAIMLEYMKEKDVASVSLAACSIAGEKLKILSYGEKTP